MTRGRCRRLRTVTNPCSRISVAAPKPLARGPHRDSASSAVSASFHVLPRGPCRRLRTVTNACSRISVAAPKPLAFLSIPKGKPLGPLARWLAAAAPNRHRCMFPHQPRRPEAARLSVDPHSVGPLARWLAASPHDPLPRRASASSASSALSASVYRSACSASSAVGASFCRRTRVGDAPPPCAGTPMVSVRSHPTGDLAEKSPRCPHRGLRRRGRGHRIGVPGQTTGPAAGSPSPGSGNGGSGAQSSIR
jgi:hypothetical protein